MVAIALRRSAGVGRFWPGTMVYRFGQLLGLAMVVMGLAHSISRERMFEWLRSLLGGRETRLGYLVSCSYCLSHWIAFVLVPITGVYPLDVPVRWGVMSRVLHWFLSSILVVMVAAFLRVVFYFVDETQGLVKRQQKVAEREAENPHG